MKLNPCAFWQRKDRRIHICKHPMFIFVGRHNGSSKVKDDIANSCREGDKVLMVHGGVNKAGRFLEVPVYAEGGRRGVLWLPEGCYGQGWRHFAGDLRLMLPSAEGKNGIEEIESLPLPRTQT
jgi:hypothetical protein